MNSARLSAIMSRVASASLLLLNFAAAISINLAVINALPLPALDGGQLVFVLVEVLRRGRISKPRFYGRVNPADSVFAIVESFVVLVQQFVPLPSGRERVGAAVRADDSGCEWRWGPSDRVASPLELSRCRAPPPRREETESHTRAKFHLAFGLESFSSTFLIHFFPDSHFPTPS